MPSRPITTCSVLLVLVFTLGFSTEERAGQEQSGNRPRRAFDITGSSYRDKHGNEGTIILASPLVNPGASGIEYTVPYTSTDSDGNKSGEYWITSGMLPGRDPNTDDFVLNVFVIDDATQNAAELVIRNNPGTAPLMPILRLLDCSSIPCAEVKVYDDPKWGCWVIQDQWDIANYPIELLDTRVILNLLEPAQLSMLPNSADGTGNWAEIMENHRTSFQEARFRADVDHLGERQSALLTSRMIAEIEAHHNGLADDWLVRHSDIQHHALTFLTAHRVLIEDMTTVLFNDHFNNWPLNFTFPFGRMPIWLVDPDLDAGPDSGEPFSIGCGGPGNPCHVLPLHWEQVISGLDPLTSPGCYHDWPLDGYTPTRNNGSMNIGQYECAEVITPNGFVDRPCTDPDDYFAMGIDGDIDGELEGAWHDYIHGFIRGSFGSPATTAGTMVFWIFHTYASTTELSNWRHAQKRDMGIPMANSPPTVDCPADVIAECNSPDGTEVTLKADVDDADDDDLTVTWGVDGMVVQVDVVRAGSSVSLTHSYSLGEHEVTVTVDDGVTDPVSCWTIVTVEDTTPPVVEVGDLIEMWPPNHTYRTFDLSDCILSIEDACDGPLDVGSATILSIYSDEPEDADGDGHTFDDIVILGPTSFKVRKERQGRGNGRVYGITFEVFDAAGNGTEATCFVGVPHDQAGDPPVDDGPGSGYTVFP